MPILHVYSLNRFIYLHYFSAFGNVKTMLTYKITSMIEELEFLEAIPNVREYDYLFIIFVN